jgi:hypothetical protein
MKLTITLNFRDDDGSTFGDGSDANPFVCPTVIDVPVVPPLAAPPRLALPRPRPWWRSKRPNMLDGAVVAATAAAVAWWLL